MGTIIDRFWHGVLRRPYVLARVVDQGADGDPTVVLLHGIGQSGNVWKHLVRRLVPHGCRVVAFDLLGFGASPKPDRLRYDVDDHARAVIASLRRLRLQAPVVLVGHSMGCLVALRVARLRPDLVRHLVLYEMPLYKGLPAKLRYRLRLDAYSRFYRWVINYQPTFGAPAIRRSERLARKVVGFEVTPESWLPFVRSLEHTIMHQTTDQDIKLLAMPLDAIYGRLDMFVIGGKAVQTFATDLPSFTAHTVRARHVISPKAAAFIASRIEAALHA